MRRLKQNEIGSITLEAAIVVPIFMSFLLLFITLIRMAMIDIALYQAVNQATQQISSHSYAAHTIYDRYRDSPTGQKLETLLEQIKQKREDIDQITQPSDELEAMIQWLSPVLPEEYQQILMLGEQINQGLQDATDQALGLAFQPLVDRYADDRILDLENLFVTKVLLPDLVDHSQPYFGLETRYDFQLPLPFLNKNVTFQHQAYERTWVGDLYPERSPDEDSLVNDGEQEDEEALVIHSISSPVQRGRQVILIAYGPKNATANVQLYYVTTFQKVESCTSNDLGRFYCEIDIGGNAKEGEFLAVMSLNGLQDQASFQVLSKSNMEKYKRNRAKGIYD